MSDSTYQIIKKTWQGHVVCSRTFSVSILALTRRIMVNQFPHNKYIYLSVRSDMVIMYILKENTEYSHHRVLGTFFFHKKNSNRANSNISFMCKYVSIE